MVAPARTAAYDILSAVSAGRADLPTAIAAARATLKDERDRSLAADIALGVQRWRAALDHLIVHFSKRQIDRIDPEIVEILRLGVYQLLHLTRVPAAAVVDDAVDLARLARKRSACGLVNAVLRAIARSRRALPLPPKPDDPSDREAVLDYLSVTLSHPRWLMDRWYARLGFEQAERWAIFNNRPAPVTLRANRIRSSPQELMATLVDRGVRVRPGLYAPDALVVEPGQPLGSLRQLEGAFLVQDEASQLVGLLAGRSPGPLVLDACAAPGGKATALAAVLGERGIVVACDVRARRTRLLRQTVSTAGAHNIRIVRCDLAAGLPFTARFSCVLVDAPCSGLGILRRDPDIRWRRLPSDLPVLSATQRRMLDNAASAVAVGGRLIYATCSSEPEENERVADGFLQGAPEFAPLDARMTHAELPASVVDARGHLRTAPDPHGLESFFGAVFVRQHL